MHRETLSRDLLCRQQNLEEVLVLMLLDSCCKDPSVNCDSDLSTEVGVRAIVVILHL